MKDENQRPNLERILCGLKDFQRTSVEYVFQRLYKDTEPANRFLIADEVGLGKTLVAKGLIAKTVDYLWEKEDHRIDIIYICSNSGIARQNINRLNITADKNMAMTSRITLLPLQRSTLDKRLNFISFTPGTSFDLGQQNGLKQERAMLYHILKKAWGFGERKGPIKFFQGSVGGSWEDYLRNFLKSENHQIDPELEQSFLKRLKDQTAASAEQYPNLKNRFEEVAEVYGRARKAVAGEGREKRNKIIGELRSVLAASCIYALQPDLIILDEFQRFAHLLDGKDEVSELAHQLFDYPQAKVILLSATPYKMYTLQNECEDDDHYRDFMRTIGFLFGCNVKTEDFKEILKAYRRALYQVGNGGLENLKQLKQKIEAYLRAVMIRTERLPQTKKNDGMVAEFKDNLSLEVADIQEFVFYDQLTKELGVNDPLEFWKSAPFLLNFMDDHYAFKTKFKSKALTQKGYKILAPILDEAADKLFDPQTIWNYNSVNITNAKLRALLETMNSGSWKLLWLPPTLPYYEGQGVFEDPDLKSFTKGLVFSSWQVVPKVISMLVSYEAERRAVKAFDPRANYLDERQRRSQLLRFSKQQGRFTGMPVLTLLYPCLTLAQALDPLAISQQLAKKESPAGYEQFYSIARERVENLIKKFPVTGKSDRPVDERWYWAILAMMDKIFHPEVWKRWAEVKDEGLLWRLMIKGKNNEDEDASFAEHVDYFYSFDPEDLGQQPGDLGEVITKIALGSPAISALRSFGRVWSQAEITDTLEILSASALIATGFRTLYNLPESSSLIRSLHRRDRREVYWKAVLDYGIDGNLQALMDEYFHILYESLGLNGKGPSGAAMEMGEEVYAAVALRTTALNFEEIEVNNEEKRIDLKEHRMRCRYALRLSEGKAEEGNEVTREDQVRIAFNSPFRPFILATTSIGQEGLDFHQYCHAIYHWNLPSNPVDLEQREGRIHRYKGHVIRKNLAKKYGLPELKSNENDTYTDPWSAIFAQAKADRSPDANDLVPYWIYEDNDEHEENEGYKIERHVLFLPLSREASYINDLKRTLVAYRMVFGQPRQEDLLRFLTTHFKDDEELKEFLNYRIDLRPRVIGG